MPKRTKIVATMLTTARQITASAEFARDAHFNADLAQAADAYDTASALRGMSRAREVEAMLMRVRLSDLADALADLPV